ncbi:magnesium-dependent phosphatase 1-like [Oscarella lobularis]|uniref:magnesium-dependent phosphatase 1-like n=1 Tax=Oscarella lobularis TaxID=121494 RepID=UPI003313EC13
MNEGEPRLVVFDLDYTVWPLYVDTDVTPPFKPEGRNCVKDSYGERVKPFPEVLGILDELSAKGICLGAASRTTAVTTGRKLLQALDLDKYFKYKEIYPGSKVAHFKRFQEESGFAYRDMLFFDDEPRNIVEVSKLGVTCILVENGMSRQDLKLGFEKFKNRSS